MPAPLFTNMAIYDENSTTGAVDDSNYFSLGENLPLTYAQVFIIKQEKFNSDLYTDCQWYHSIRIDSDFLHQ